MNLSSAAHLQSFTIHKLFGIYTYRLEFSENKLIIVGENGCGKTTMLNLFYGFVTRNYDLLGRFEFESLEVVLTDGTISTIKKSELVNDKSKETLSRNHFILFAGLQFFSNSMLNVLAYNYGNREEEVKGFVAKVNSYLTDKYLVFTKNKLSTMELRRKRDNALLNADGLSAGENRLLTVLSYIFLANSDKQPIFILIDDPELSMSIEWQKTFLEDLVNIPNVVGLFAATHSPFVFDNSLQRFTVGVSQFLLES